MHFSLATIIAVVPLLASASPLAKQPHSTVSLARKSHLHQEDGSLDADKLKGHLAVSVESVRIDAQVHDY
jgi:cathepsin D